MAPTQSSLQSTGGGAGDLWVILLAGGDGSRVHGLATDADGVVAPKQYCTLDGRESMLQWAVARALGMVPATRLVPVVATQHRRWWARELAGLPAENFAVQPCNRGTAVGILFPLLKILQRDSLARVLVLPCDHHVRDEGLLRRRITRAVRAVDTDRSQVVLLGMVPRGSDTEYGWIVPVRAADLARVETFVEKPDAEKMQSLVRRGAVLNSLIFVTKGRTLLQLYLRTLPEIVGEFVTWQTEDEGRWPELVALYRTLPTHDFGREVLERSADQLSVVCATGCGWADLGTPGRLRRFGVRPVPPIAGQWTPGSA